MRPRTSLRVACPWLLTLLVSLAGCTTPDPNIPRDAARASDSNDGRTPAFYACTDNAQCTQGTACTNWGSGTAYCRPLCADDDACVGYPYAGLRCQDVTTAEGEATELRACNDGPRTVLVGGASDACRSSTSCAACTPRTSCGWCGATGTCRTGTRTGPSAGACDGAWAWVSSECPLDGAVVPPDDVVDGALDTDEVAPDVADASVEVVDVAVDVGPRDVAFDASEACVPRCVGRSCGDDGCGGSCGPCGFGRTCTDAGTCSACTPDCVGRSCGPDGCGGACGQCLLGGCDANGRCPVTPCPLGACRSLECGDGGSSLGVACSCGTCRGDQVCSSGRCTCAPCPSGTVCYQLSCCRPDCTGRVCGSNGCGGTCGECSSGLGCNDVGRCVCVPRCAGRECGSDGCLGSCGTCSGGRVCAASGTCCTPSCSGRRCGDNGCGGSCGTCATGQTCNDAGQCVTGCVRNCVARVCGSDGCGGSCGVCGSGLTCNSVGLCTATSSCTDNAHCVTTVSAVRGASCGSASSLDVTVRNSCSATIAIQLCLRRSDGTCNCGLDSAVSAGGTFSFYTCQSNGTWSYRAGSTSDVGRGCFPTSC